MTCYHPIFLTPSVSNFCDVMNGHDVTYNLICSLNPKVFVCAI